MQIRIIAECYVDTALAKFFIGDEQLVDHQSGIGNVGNAMKNAPSSENEILLGWIDNDKNKPRYFDDFQTIIDENNVLIKKSKTANQYLIIIQPAAERFLLEAGKELATDFKLFQLPSDFKEFKNLTKNPSIEKDTDFKHFIKHLAEGKAASFETLKVFFEKLIVK